MRELEALRREIDDIDAQLARLVVRRLTAAEEIGTVKREKGLPVTNAERENAVLSSAEAASPRDMRGDVRRVMELLIALSKRRQQRRI